MHPPLSSRRSLVRRDSLDIWRWTVRRASIRRTVRRTAARWRPIRWRSTIRGTVRRRTAAAVSAAAVRASRVAHECFGLRNIGIIRGEARELRGHSIFDPLVFLLADEFAGEWRRAALDADAGAIRLSGMLTLLATAATCSTSAAASEQLRPIKSLGERLT